MAKQNVRTEYQTRFYDGRHNLVVPELVKLSYSSILVHRYDARLAGELGQKKGCLDFIHKFRPKEIV